MGRFLKYLVAYNFHIIARALILLLGTIVFFIAFISGAEDFRGGIDGILLNSPYSIAWLILLTVLLVAWVWELAGGITITISSLFGLYMYFAFHNDDFGFSFLLLVIGLFLLGISLILSWTFSLLEEDPEESEHYIFS